MWPLGVASLRWGEVGIASLLAAVETARCYHGYSYRRVPGMGSWVPGTPPFSLKMQDFASFFEIFHGGAPGTPPP